MGEHSTGTRGPATRPAAGALMSQLRAFGVALVIASGLAGCPRSQNVASVPDRTIGLFGTCATHEDCPAPFQCIEYPTFSGESRRCGMLCNPEEAEGGDRDCLPGWRCREGGGHAPSVCSRGYSD